MRYQSRHIMTDKKNNIRKIIDFAAPFDGSVEAKEVEKLKNIKIYLGNKERFGTNK